MMPVKVIFPVEAAPKKVKLGPMVLMSGFMTKKTRSLNSKWKQRWWQLMDDGFLYYFKSDDHPQKLLGKIDVGKTCYDVKLGAEMCRVRFPRPVPSCCCFSFAVINRTYYVYTPTPGEAEKWSQAITGLSKVINRKIVAGLERRKAPEIPGMSTTISGNLQISITRVRTRWSQDGISDSCQDITRVQYLPLKTNGLSASKKFLASSVPNCLDGIGLQEISRSQLASSGFLLGKNTSAQASELPLGQQSGFVTSEEMQVSSSLQFSFMTEHPLSEGFQQTSHQQKHQKGHIKELEQKFHIQKADRHRSRSVEDIFSPHKSGDDSLLPTRPRPVPKPRKGKAARNSSNQGGNSPEWHSLENVPGSEMIEVTPALPSPLHQLPLTTHPRKSSAPLLYPREKSIPSSPPLPTHPQQNDNTCTGVIPPSPLSSPPSSRRKGSFRATSHSLRLYPKEEKPVPPPRPRTETATASLSSPPRPRKKTMMVDPPSKQQAESATVITAKPKFIAPPPPSV